MEPHDTASPFAWVTRWAGEEAAGGRVLDVACGSGRHARYFAARGHPVAAVDRDRAALGNLIGVPGVTTLCADLEQGEWPYPGEEFAAVVVTNYLHRPLFPQLLSALGRAGVLIYETFAAGNERFGRPSNPAFLLRPGELLDLARGRLRVRAYEDLLVADPRPALIQRLCAVKGESG